MRIAALLLVGMVAMIVADFQLSDYRAELFCWAVVLIAAAALYIHHRKRKT